MAHLKALPEHLLLEVFYFTCAKDLLQFRTSSKSFNHLITKSEIANTLWSKKLKQDFSYDEQSEGNGSFTCMKINNHLNERIGRSCISIFGNYLKEDPLFTSNSAFEAYASFSKANEILYQNIDPLPKLNASYLLRSAQIWYELASWCMDPDLDQFGPDFKFRNKLLRSFYPGVKHRRGRFCFKEVDHNQISKTMASDCLFAFCDGQKSPTDAESAAVSLFGGFQVYNHAQLMMLVGSSEIMPGLSKEQILASDIMKGVPSIVLSLDTGNVELITSYGRVVIASGQDAALVWFENYVHKLVRGEIEVTTGSKDDHPFDDDWTYISPFPTARSSRASRCVTRGIEVIASAIPAHEIDTIVYSIRIRMLKEGEEGYLTPQERGFEMCQLHTRHWKLVNLDSNDIDRVNGEGVIGKFPILFEGGFINGSGERNIGSFIYQSCTGRDMKTGTFEGHMSFIPGSIRQPKGEIFNVYVGQFELSMSPSLL